MTSVSARSSLLRVSQGIVPLKMLLAMRNGEHSSTSDG